MPPLPGPFRAALGVVATVVDDRRSLPDRALVLPVLAVSTALQMSLRAQQRYAALTAKGDEFLSQLHGAADAPPEWARFDDEDEPPPLAPIGVEDIASRRAATTQGATKPATKSVQKSVKKPRTGRPSAFDQAGDDQAGPSTS